MDCCSEPLRSNVDMDNHSLRFAGQTSITVSHRQCYHLWSRQYWLLDYRTRAFYLVRTCNNTWELSLFLILTFDDCFNDTRMIRTEVHEAMGDSSLARYLAGKTSDHGSHNIPPISPRKRQTMSCIPCGLSVACGTNDIGTSILHFLVELVYIFRGPFQTKDTLQLTRLTFWRDLKQVLNLQSVSMSDVRSKKDCSTVLRWPRISPPRVVIPNWRSWGINTVTRCQPQHPKHNPNHI